MGKHSRVKPACTVVLLCAATAIALPAQTFTTLVSFDGTNGSESLYGSLVQGRDGNLYGTTAGGGVNSEGTVFKITPSGTLITLYSFCSQASCQDGANPEASIILGNDGNFYGTTYVGGASGDGTIFKITSGGSLSTLHSFLGTDGAFPEAGLIQAIDGNLYGTAYGGGDGDGTAFKITPAGTFTLLHTFEGMSDGAIPFGPLVQGTDGNFYGTTIEGGANGLGTVFKMSPSGTLATLHSFDYTDGDSPAAGLIQATNGNFYGTTVTGGSNGFGTVFKITPGGVLTTLHSFDSTDGAYPYGGLTQGTDGKFYGTTTAGGNNGGYGTVFEITPAGTLTVVHTFDNTDGSSPEAAPAQSTNGSFYGTTFSAGANGDGTVFRFTEGLGPFVETLPTSGKVGWNIQILGPNLTGTTSVTFNGTAATFKVLSGSLIGATVPAGATTGTVKVSTPKGTLKSNVVFRVEP
ncbi:MAG TPA: choice-of-anchor tandem repeat GloVer-containing protein [Terriglobia bacterium]|nr:choice-of-anchor tandem repeat GloVer-containing protein [Terriglobia bacterium]